MKYFQGDKTTPFYEENTLLGIPQKAQDIKKLNVGIVFRINDWVVNFLFIRY